MTHIGDICNINGAEIEPVDCIIGGSPCQDLSIAGKRAGLAGNRSGLFMEQIRIIKEMRENDRANGWSGEFIRPRYMVWENVPGAFSANEGADFAAVLEETVRIVETEAPPVPVPEKGWPTAGCLMGDGWSVAWRVLDAQYWGVPQRRRRIALIADFGGESAPEILFNPSGLQGNPSPSGKTRERAAETPQGSTSFAVRERGGCAGGGKGPLVQEEISGTIATGNDQTTFCLQGNAIDRADTARCNGKGWKEDKCYTLNTIDRPAVCAGFKLGNSEAARSIGCAEELVPTLNAECGGNKPAIIAPAAYSFSSLASNSMKSKNPLSGCRVTETAKTLDTSPPDPSKNQGGVANLDMAHACDVIRDGGDVSPSLQARMGTGGNQVPLTYTASGYGGFRGGIGTLRAQGGDDGGGSENLCATAWTVRRLTPLECERLQGFPDGWTDIGAWTDSKGKLHKESSDSARYKAMGNSIALPPWKWVLKRLCANYERDATLGSLFDGVGGFPLIWSQLNGVGSVKWASEVEEFPIAVTKRHCEEGLI